MYQAIETKYAGPTNTRDARILASATAGNMTTEWNHTLNPDENHKLAALAFAAKFEWIGTWNGGVIKSGNYVFVCTEKGDKPAFVIEARN